MSEGRKYARLPDLDTAPDVYATPDVEDDTSNAQRNSRSRTSSHSSSSSYRDVDENEASTQDHDEDDAASGINHRKLRPDEARTRFSRSRIDARKTDFSGRIGHEPGSSGYRVTTSRSWRRRRKQNGRVEDAYGDFSEGEVGDEDDDESLEERIARLKREAEEVKNELERRSQAQVAVKRDGDGVTARGGEASNILELSRLLSEIQTSQQTMATQPRHFQSPGQVPALAQNGDDKTISKPAAFQQVYENEDMARQFLAQTTAFEARITSLERSLGIPFTAVSATTKFVGSKNVLTTLSLLERQTSSLTTTTATSIDTLSTTIHQLTVDAGRLTSARQSAKEARDALNASMAQAPPSYHQRMEQSSDYVSSTTAKDNTASTTAPDINDAEHVAKVESLYRALPTVENLSSLLPSVLDRMRALRALHARAASAGADLTTLEQRQEDVDRELKTWREGLGKVDTAIKNAGEVANANKDVVEQWVKDLEARVGKLE